MNSEITFYQNIKPLFRVSDRTCMKDEFDLYSYDDVSENADKIYKALNGDPRQMPPDGKWSQENINKFKTWKDTGKKEGNPPEREAFYKLLNIESFPEFLQTAQEMAHGYLKKAESIADNPPVELKNFKYFEFTQEAFNERLELIYNDLEKEAEGYQPAIDPIYDSRNDVIERVRQYAPFNQIDGAWLRNAVKIGPTNEITSLLSDIYDDELGNGQVELNHSTLYTTLLASCGIHLPDIYQRAYAEDPKFLDSAFSAPVLSLSVSQFSELFFPEILGFTLQIEWTVLDLVSTSKLFKYYGVDPHFYDMHIAIDNASSGHGAKAKRAIELYLDYVRQDGGADAVQEHWRRIWIGFVAFWNTGTLSKDLSKMLDQRRIGRYESLLMYDRTLSHKDFNIGKSHLGQPDLRQRMINMIAYKAPYASRNHKDRKFGNKPINEWFNNPEDFLDALVESSYVVKGDPENSPILAHLTTWDGPMYKVFTGEELNLWNDWIRSLDPNIPLGPTSFNIVTEMKRLIRTLKNNQYATMGHSHVLTGPDPNDPNNFITKDVHWWIEKNDPIWVMKALICDKNEQRMVVPGHPEKSPFITRMMAPANKMGSTFANIAISRGPVRKGENISSISDSEPSEPWSWKDVAYQWIQLNCPLDETHEVVGFQALYTHPKGVIKHHIHGPGRIH